jgi:hypothetical protein
MSYILRMLLIIIIGSTYILVVSYDTYKVNNNVNRKGIMQH